MTDTAPASKGICTYCAEVKPLTADHVPPKNIFRKPYPANMWTVPACAKCNGGSSRDDEYFRVALTVTEKAKGQTDRDAVLPSVMRGLNHPKSERFQRRLLSSSSLRPRFSHGGLYLGNQPAISFDGARLDRSAIRITKGLFLKVKKHRLPDDHAVNAVNVFRFAALGALHPELDLALRQFVSLVSAEPRVEFGDAFAFQWLQSPNGGDHTMWLLHFYGQLEYYCTTYALSSVENTTLEQELAQLPQGQIRHSL